MHTAYKIDSSTSLPRCHPCICFSPSGLLVHGLNLILHLTYIDCPPTIENYWAWIVHVYVRLAGQPRLRSPKRSRFRTSVLAVAANSIINVSQGHAGMHGSSKPTCEGLPCICITRRVMSCYFMSRQLSCGQLSCRLVPHYNSVLFQRICKT